MRLISIRVKNYRVLQDEQVELENGLTLIGGPNETGKSTLMEAAHRALFLKARITGEARESMLSLAGGAPPEVSVTFGADGKTWQILKRFSGQGGQATLTESGGATWKGEEAEARLAEILGVSAPAGKRGAKEQWAHLWVWQGSAGGSPSDHANAQKGSLLSGLEQAEGPGAACLQSALDSQLAARFQERHREMFKQNGEPRIDSAWGRAEEEWKRAQEAAALALTRCEALGRSAAAFEAATSALEQAVRAEAEVAPQLLQTETGLARVIDLRTVESRQVAAWQGVEQEHQRLEAIETQMATLNTAIAKLTEALAPEEQLAGTLAREEAEATARLEHAQAVQAAAAAARLAAQQTHDLAAARLRWLEKSTEAAELQGRRQTVEGLQAEERRLSLELAGLPLIDAAGLKQLESLEKNRDQAAATLRGMATAVRVLEADQTVRLNGVVVASGQETVVDSASELVVGSGVRVRLVPGGGAGLEKARGEQARAENSLVEMLHRLALPSLEAAAGVLERRRQLEAERATTRQRLLDQEAEQLPSRMASSLEELESARALLERLRAAGPGGLEPAEEAGDRPTAVARHGQTAQNLQAAQRDEEVAAAAAAAAQRALLALQERVRGQAAALAGRRSDRERAVTQRDFLISSHGEEPVRRAAVAAAATSLEAAASALAATRAELTAWQPEVLDADLARLRRSLAEIDKRRRDAETAQAIARSELTRDGGDDPHEALAQARAREASAAEAEAQARREAEAIRLLHRLFAEEQRALASRLTRPLAEKINGYLQCLFGPAAEVVLAFEDQLFGELALVRPGRHAGAVSFAALSGGAREQVAAAMRLAMAEVLAAGHDGCLPVVFDDAFAYADPQRVKSLQRMLDLAARRGLQMIVLTCTPGDYVGLGARLVTLTGGRQP